MVGFLLSPAFTSPLHRRLFHVVSPRIYYFKALALLATSPYLLASSFGLLVLPQNSSQDHCILVDCAQLDAGSCVAAATRCLESIVRRFGGFIRDTLAAPVAAGRVDLAREDRIARCREAHRVS